MRLNVKLGMYKTLVKNREGEKTTVPEIVADTWLPSGNLMRTGLIFL